MHSSFSRVSSARAAQSLSVRLSPLALACAFICLPAQAQTQTPTPTPTPPSTALPEVQVTGQAERIGQQLAQPARSASHTGVSNQEVPASVDGVSAEQMQERGDYALVDAVTRTVGLTASSTPGNGGLSFSSRGFAGVNSVGVAEDGMVLGVAAGTTAYP
ncbi:TonB-dependent receptor plug domain-containing protein, partial [Delftia acidovorans]